MVATLPRGAVRPFDFPGGGFVMQDVLLYSGDLLFVDSALGTDDAGHGRQPGTGSFASLHYANSKATANNGDVIALARHHNEGLGNAQIALNKDGVTVLALGEGAQRARIDFDHANASIDITGNGVRVVGLRLLPSVTDVLVGIDVNAAALDCRLEGIEVLPGEDGAGVDEFARSIDIKAGCTRTTILAFKHRQHASAAGVIAPISLTGASDDVRIEGADIVALGAGVLAPISGITTLSTNVRIIDCILQTDNEPGIELLTGTTGVLSGNRIFSNLATIAAAIVADGCALFENEYVEVGGERGALIGTASADD